MNQRLIFIGESGSGKSTAALGFMSAPKDTYIIQHKGSAGFRFLATVAALKEMVVGDASNFEDFSRHTYEAIKAKRNLIIVDDYDYLFRDEQRKARQGETGNAQRLASQGIYQQAENVVKDLMECGATVIFTCKAVAKSGPKEGNSYVTDYKPFLPGLHEHMETGLVDGVFHFIRAAGNYEVRTKGWQTQTGSQINRYYAKTVIGLGDFMPESIKLIKEQGKPYSLSVRSALKKAQEALETAFTVPSTETTTAGVGGGK